MNCVKCQDVEDHVWTGPQPAWDTKWGGRRVFWAGLKFLNYGNAFFQGVNKILGGTNAPSYGRACEEGNRV